MYELLFNHQPDKALCHIFSMQFHFAGASQCFQSAQHDSPHSRNLRQTSHREMHLTKNRKQILRVLPETIPLPVRIP